jgi:hypothetical protein
VDGKAVMCSRVTDGTEVWRMRFVFSCLRITLVETMTSGCFELSISLVGLSELKKSHTLYACRRTPTLLAA